MKLQEFFNTHKETHITDIEKLNLYQNILYKKTKKTSLKRASFVSMKRIAYTMVFAVLLFGVYGVYFVNNNSQEYSRFSIIKNTSNTAQADYIGQVIDAKGNFFVEHDGVLSKTNNISNGDTLLLKADTQLVFEIDSGTQSKIIGPAKLIIQQTDASDYKLNLIYGDFIQMEGNDKKQSIELAVNNITIKPQDKNKPLNFKFVKNGNDQILQNNGANIIVTKSNGTDKTTTVTNKQVFAIQNNDIKIFANIDSFTKAIQEKNISQSFAFQDAGETSEKTGEKTNEDEVLLSLLNAPQISAEINKEVINDISSVLGDEKKIIDPDLDEKIRSYLYEGSYMPEVKAILAAFTAGQEAEFDSAYAKLEKRIGNIGQLLGIDLNKQAGTPAEKLNGLYKTILSLQTNITAMYNISPEYPNHLQTIAKSLNDIVTKGYGSAAVHPAADEEIPTESSMKQ